MSDWIKRRSYIRTAVRMIYAKSCSACFMNTAQWVLCMFLHIYAHMCVCVSALLWLTVTRWLFTQCVFSTLCINTIKDRKQNKLTPETQVPQPSPHILHYHTFSLHREAGLGHSDKLISGKRVWNGNSVNLSFSFSSITIRLFLCGPCRAPAVQAGPRCLPWCLLLQQLPPYFLLLIWGSFFSCRHPLMILRHRNISLLCNPEQRACANQAPTVLTHFYKVR